MFTIIIVLRIGSESKGFLINVQFAIRKQIIF